MKLYILKIVGQQFLRMYATVERKLVTELAEIETVLLEPSLRAEISSTDECLED